MIMFVNRATEKHLSRWNRTYPWRKTWSRCSTSLQNCQSLLRSTTDCSSLSQSWQLGSNNCICHHTTTFIKK